MSKRVDEFTVLFIYLLIAGVTALQVYSMSKAGLEEQYRKQLIKLPKEIGRSLIQNPKY